MPTPDDIAGGVTDAGKLILRDEALSLDAPGEARYNEGTGSFEMRDNAGTFNPRTGGASFDEKVKVSLDDTTSAFLEEKLTAGSGITLTVQNDGGNELLEIAAGQASQTPYALVCPQEIDVIYTSSVWEIVGLIFYRFADYDSQSVKEWRGRVLVGSRETYYRVVRVSDGAVVGEVTLAAGSGMQTVIILLNQNLPSADDTLMLQHSRASGGGQATESELYSGNFKFGT